MAKIPTGPGPSSTAITKGGKFRASVFLPLELHDALRKLAVEKRVSLSELIVAALVQVYGEPPYDE